MRVLAGLAAAIGLCVAFVPLAAAQAGPVPCARMDGKSLRDVHWQRTQRKHPLIGQVLKGDGPIALQGGACERTPLQQLIVEVWDTIRNGGIVLLGEVRDNPEHHAVRGDVLRPLFEKLASTRGLHPAAVFEHIRATQQPQLDRFYTKAARSRRLWRAADLLRELDWKNTGWPDGEIFYPLFDAALRSRMPILPGNADRQQMRELVRGDHAKATPEDKARLDLAGALSQPLLEALGAELVQSHCGVLPASAIPTMSLAQRYVDAHLAEATVAAARRHRGAFLLAGDGHVRTDRGVPF